MSSAKILTVLAISLSLAIGCKSEEKKKEEESPAKPVETTDKPAELSAVTLGVESPRAFGYRWGKGSKEYGNAEKLLKEEARDWKAIAGAAQAAVTADKNHLAAHRLLGIALANTGEDKKAAEHLSIALAADWIRWGPSLAADKSLAEFLKTEAGKGLLALNDKYKEQFYALANAGVLVVAKRTGWKPSKKTGRQWAASRGELFAYHLDEERFLRLTHTGEAVVGFIHSPSKDRIAYLAVTHYEFGETGPFPIATASVGVLETSSYLQIGKSARVKKSAPSLALYYGAGEELLLDAGKTVYSVDVEGGKLKKSRDKGVGDLAELIDKAPSDNTVLFSNSELSRVFAPKPTKMAAANAIAAGDGNAKIELPTAGGEAISAVTWSPDKKRLTIVGIGDPCQKDHQSTIYVVEAETGALKHVHRGGGRQQVQWLDENRFIFEAEARELRVYDAASKNTTHTIKNKSGISLSAVSNVTAGEWCESKATQEEELGGKPPSVDQVDKNQPLKLPAKTGASGKGQTP